MNDDAADAPVPDPRPVCLCMGLGPELTHLLRRLSPPDQVWEQLRSAELDLLKAVRSLIDDRIHALTREPPHGTRIRIEEG